MVYIAKVLDKRRMKRTLFEKSFVVVLFVLVIIIFSFAERDTQKAFAKYNTKSTVASPVQKENFTAETSEKNEIDYKVIGN